MIFDLIFITLSDIIVEKIGFLIGFFYGKTLD